MSAPLRAALDEFERGDFAPFASLLADDVRWDGWSTGYFWWRNTPT